VIEFTGAGKLRRRLALGLTGMLLVALVVNIVAPYGLLYSEITGLRTSSLPWGENIVLASGQPSQWGILTDTALLALVGFVVDGCVRLWRRRQVRRAAALGSSLAFFVLVFTLHGRLVDTGVLDLPYMNTYAYVVVVLAMNHVLAGAVVEASNLSQEIAANERRWRLLLDNVRVFVLGMDRQGRVSHVNSYFEEVTGYKAAEVIGRSFEQLLPDNVRPRFRQRFRELMSGTPHPEVESVLRTKDGRERNTLWANVALYDARGDITGSLSIGTDITEIRQKEADLRAAVDEERSRIAGDLHDSVTQTLFSTAAIADALPEVWSRYPEEARRGLEELRQLTKGALAEMRTLLLELRPAALREKGLGELLGQLADATVARTRIPVTAEVACDRDFPENVQIALYRVAQEALNNVVKHAQGQSATIRLEGDSETVVLAIADDGRSFDPRNTAPGRLGLGIMRDRVRSIGAEMVVEARPGRGTTIKVTWRDPAGGDSDG
jgi:PAS domain S-box-containing protein